MYLGSAVLGGHLILGDRGTCSPRTSCPGGHVRGGHTSVCSETELTHKINNKCRDITLFIN